MTLQNRVTPWGEIVAAPARGRLMGNRGRLHGPDKRLGKARWRGKAWISCVLDFKERHREVMAKQSYTELFFSDEAVAIAAGHRPCAECRRAAFLRFRAAMARAFPELSPALRAADMDMLLHAARTSDAPRARVRPFDLPRGAFCEGPGGEALLIWDGSAWRWSFGGYTPFSLDPAPERDVLTPAPFLAALRHGYGLDLQPDLSGKVDDKPSDH